MAELVDALDLGSSAARREGSSPFVRISDMNSSPSHHENNLLDFNTLWKK